LKDIALHDGCHAVHSVLGWRPPVRVSREMPCSIPGTKELTISAIRGHAPIYRKIEHFTFNVEKTPSSVARRYTFDHAAHIRLQSAQRRELLQNQPIKITASRY
jgi:hypothetical protein